MTHRKLLAFARAYQIPHDARDVLFGIVDDIVAQARAQDALDPAPDDADAPRALDASSTDPPAEPEASAAPVETPQDVDGEDSVRAVTRRDLPEARDAPDSARAVTRRELPEADVARRTVASEVSASVALQETPRDADEGADAVADADTPVDSVEDGHGRLISSLMRSALASGPRLSKRLWLQPVQLTPLIDSHDTLLEAEMGRLEQVGRRTDTQAAEIAEADADVALASDDASSQRDIARYEDLGVIGVGGMGEVRRVRDRDLNRTLAMKIIKPGLLDTPTSLLRFIEEAQATAQLQHPGIIPVYELGRLADGRFYFTMQEIRGRTLHAVLDELHRESAAARAWTTTPSGVTFRRVIDVFRRVCETVAYAHRRGVIHRDLKPSNIMVGDDGEVLVVDWGIAKVMGRADLAAEVGALDVIETDRARDARRVTRFGAVAGTPAYMPPEQARGEIDRITERSDVYALGAILYELLCGQPPYVDAYVVQVLAKVCHGPPPDVAEVARLPLPRELTEVCARAMAREPDGRYAEAGELADAITDWLEGARRRERALELVERAAQSEAQAAELRAESEQLHAVAAARLADVPLWAEEARKAPGWRMEDEARALERRAALERLKAEQRLQSALTHDPELAAAHAALAERYAADHRRAEALHDEEASARAALLMRAHVDALPEHAPPRQGFLDYLEGRGALTLVTDPLGAEVELLRYEVRNRRLVPVFERALGRTPLFEVAVDSGAWLLRLRAEGRALTHYPIFIARQGHWHGAPPGAGAPAPVTLPPAGRLSDDEIYVPAGWFWAGGDPDAPGALARQPVWVDGFIMSRFPVTNAAYIAFLDDLVAQGREAEALRYAPRERAAVAGDDPFGAIIYGRDADGCFALRPDADGDIWLPEWPVVNVDWHSAAAYARWYADTRAAAWRLPVELEWEKAARGVDGRFFPWGNVHDASWCCMRTSSPDRPLLEPVDSRPVDTSPYGVRGLAGNAQDWCADVYRDAPLQRSRATLVDCRTPLTPGDGSHRVHRGGAWYSTANNCRAAKRSHEPPDYRFSDLGFRLARSYP